jgi:hypothetical protein
MQRSVSIVAGTDHALFSLELVPKQRLAHTKRAIQHEQKNKEPNPRKVRVFHYRLNDGAEKAEQITALDKQDQEDEKTQTGPLHRVSPIVSRTCKIQYAERRVIRYERVPHREKRVRGPRERPFARLRTMRMWLRRATSA